MFFCGLIRDMLRSFLRTLAIPLAAVVFPASAGAQTPAPFPRPAQPASPSPAQSSAPAPAAPPAAVAPSEQGEPQDLGVPLYPGAQFIASYDAGRGQRYYLYGAESDFLQIVGWYRTTLKQKGDLVFEEPPVHMFDIGRYREETMAFTPSVTIKDYTWAGALGYINPKRGGTPARFKTIIQIVPNPPGAAR
jgi:hypothetical protein